MSKPNSKTRKTVAKKSPAPKSYAKKPVAKTPAKTKPQRAKSAPSSPRLRSVPLPADNSAHKFVLQPFSPTSQVDQTPAFEFLGELPESYGTRRLFLAARDPRWLYAYWDFTWQQLRDAEQEAPDGKIFLQIFIPGQERVQQIHIFPGSREWYLPVHRHDLSSGIGILPPGWLLSSASPFRRNPDTPGQSLP